MLVNAQPIVLGVHLAWAFDNYTQADLEYQPEIQLKMLGGYLDRLQHFLSNAARMQYTIILTSLDEGPRLLETYHPDIKERVLQLYSEFVTYIDKLSRSWNVHTFVEHNAGDVCGTPKFNSVLSRIRNPKTYVIGGFESGCLANTINRLQGRLGVTKIPSLIFDENFEDDFKRL